MPRKKTLEEVKNEIDILSNKTVEIISDEYINSYTPLKIKCKCGEIFEREYRTLKKGFLFCSKCGMKIKKNKLREDFNNILNFIKNTGCEYVSGEYNDEYSILTYKCKCGNIFSKPWKNYKFGKHICPDCAKKEAYITRHKYSSEDAYSLFFNNGFIMIGKYENVAQKVKCVCIHGHENNISLEQVIYHDSHCRFCAYENLRKGTSLIKDYIRDIIISWKKEIRNLYNSKCAIDNSVYGYATEVHHLYSFSNIIQDAANELNIDIKIRLKISDYSTEDLNKLASLIIEKHTLQSGILISKEIHKQYHSIYGRGNNTPQQFDEFLNKYYSTSLKEIQISG